MKMRTVSARERRLRLQVELQALADLSAPVPAAVSTTALPAAVADSATAPPAAVAASSSNR